jgi:hypothetical protein
MAFKRQELVNIFAEIQRRKREVGRLSLVEFDAAEYQALESWAQRIARDYDHHIRSPDRKRHARLLFLTFAMSFVQRYKYTDDTVFWPDFEKVLWLTANEKRSLMDDLLWEAYQEEGIEHTYDGRGRRIVGSLLDEMREAEAWITQARRAFAKFFIWYYRRHPGQALTLTLVKSYNQQTSQNFTLSDKVLATLSHDCRTLATVLDYALEHDLYLDPRYLEEYRSNITAALGQQFDPACLRLIRGNEQALIRLILELQNHRTPTQLVKELQARRQAKVTAPWGKLLPTEQALRQWTPFAYGIYRIDSQEYRIVPHPQLRLEMMEEWPLRHVVQWRNLLGYKRNRSFKVTIGQREIAATPFWYPEKPKQFVWVGVVPTGEKLIIDGKLRSESSGANWQTGLVLLIDGNGRFLPGLAVERLALYCPDRPHQPFTIQMNTDYYVTDNLRSDGARRFHRHGDLTFPLPRFDKPVQLQVTVADDQVLQRTFEPPEAYLFSQRTRQQIQAQAQADVGDSVYILFTRPHLIPQVSASTDLEQLPYVYGDYHVYQVTWGESSQPFVLQAGKQNWTFATRHEFVPILTVFSRQSCVRLQPHQVQQFTDISLRFYTTWDLISLSLKLQVWDSEDLILDGDLTPYLTCEEENLYRVEATLFEELERVIGKQYGRYYLLIRQNETLLSESRVTLMPKIRVASHDSMCLEGELYHLALETDVPAWSPLTQQANTQVLLAIRPKVQVESWEEREYPNWQRLQAQTVAHPIAFPSIGESLELLWQPDVFGVRLYLENKHRTNAGKWVTVYQPINQIDYYHLEQTTLHLFALPDQPLEIRSGAYLVWQGKTDSQGQCLIESLTFLYKICTDEWTQFTANCQGKKVQLIIRWTPQLDRLSYNEDVLCIDYQGPCDTGLLVKMRDKQGADLFSWELPCNGSSQAVQLLPPPHPTGAYITVDYRLSDGTTRPTVHEIWLPGTEPMAALAPWLDIGIGVADESMLTMLCETA